MKRFFICLCSLMLLISSAVIAPSAESLDPNIELDRWEEYEAFWEENEKPQNFVTYEQLSFLGDFRSFFYPRPDVDLKKYGYGFTITPEENPRLITVIVYDDPATLLHLNEKNDVTPSGHDLREDRGTGIYRHDENLGYEFYNGKLQKVYLKIDDMVLGIESASTRWDGFDLNEDHVIAQLLNQETASLAYLEFVSLFRDEPLYLMLSPFGNGSDGADNSAKDEGCSSVASGGLGILILCAAAPMLKKKKR